MGIEHEDWTNTGERDVFSEEGPSEIEDGDGGEDMAIFESSGTDQLIALVKPGLTPDTQNQSDKLDHAVVDVSGWNVNFEDTESDAFDHDNVDSEVEDGDGGGDMVIWESSRENQLQELVKPGFYDDTQQASYQLPSGAVDVNNWNTDFDDCESDVSEQTEDGKEAEKGSGGGDMGIWARPRESQLTRLLKPGYNPNSDESSFGIPAAVVDVSNWTVSYEDVEREVFDSDNVDDEVEEGKGGGDMDIWTKKRVEILNSLVNSGMYDETFRASYPLPAGVVDASGWSTTFGACEAGNGIGVSGTAENDDGEPLSGTVYILDGDGDVVASQDVKGTFRVAAPPDPGITKGDASEGGFTYDIEFRPDGGGIDDGAEDIESGDEFEFNYEAIRGKVRDARGDPVGDDTIVVGSTSVKTDGDGEYQVVVSGETEADMVGLGGTRDKTGAAGDTVNWRYAGIEVAVTEPNSGDPISGVPVRMGNKTFETDNTGSVRWDEAPITDIPVRVMGYFDFVAEIESEGQTISESFGGEGDGDEDEDIGGLGVQVVDAQTGRSVANTDVTVPSIGTSSSTDEDGRTSALFDSNLKDIKIRVAASDPRYNGKTYTITEDTTDDEVEIELEPSVPTVNI